jgi:hypothetical protein
MGKRLSRIVILRVNGRPYKGLLSAPPYAIRGRTATEGFAIDGFVANLFFGWCS